MAAECADRGAARHPAHVERELVGQSQQPPVVPQIAERTHRREPDVEIFVVDPADERHAGVLHPQATERPGRRDSHRRLTVAEGGSDFERHGIGDRRSQNNPHGVRRVAPDRWLIRPRAP